MYLGRRITETCIVLRHDDTSQYDRDRRIVKSRMSSVCFSSVREDDCNQLSLYDRVCANGFELSFDNGA